MVRTEHTSKVYRGARGLAGGASLWGVLFILLLCCVGRSARASGSDIYTFSQQNNLYEWSAGDGNRVRANGRGTMLAVGFVDEFGELKERRVLLGNVSVPGSIKGIKNVSLVLSLDKLADVGVDAVFVACRVLEPWGMGSSNATDPNVGARAERGDATWRFPFYSEDSTPDYWENRAFGSYHTREDCVLGRTGAEKSELVFESSDFLVRYADWFVGGHGIVVMQNASGVPPSAGTLHVHSAFSEHPPHLYFELEVDERIPDYMWGIYALIGLSVVFILVVVIVLLVRTIRRNGYAPLEEIEDYVNRNAVMMTSALAQHYDILRNAGIKVIDPKDLVYDKEKNLIARGSSGHVYVATFGNEFVAVKEVMRDVDNPKALEHLIGEMVYLTELKNDHILQIIGIVIGSGRKSEIAMVMPFMREGTLAKHIHSPSHKLDFVTKIKVLYQIAIAMEYLHNATPPILHRDLKPANILLNEKLDAFVCDFGIARPEVTKMTLLGTPFYMAPEGLRGQFTTKTDVFSYGKLFIETMNESRPDSNDAFFSFSDESSLGEEGERAPLFADNGVQDVFGDIISAAIAPQPSERPSFRDIVDFMEQYIGELDDLDTSEVLSQQDTL